MYWSNFEFSKPFSSISFSINLIHFFFIPIKLSIWKRFRQLVIIRFRFFLKKPSRSQPWVFKQFRSILPSRFSCELIYYFQHRAQFLTSDKHFTLTISIYIYLQYNQKIILQNVKNISIQIITLNMSQLELDNTMSMNSLMDCIYGINPTYANQTTLTLQQTHHCLDQIPQFMQSLIMYLNELCLTNSAVENIQTKLRTWVRQYRRSIHKNQKRIVEEFFREYLQLLQQQTQKIKKLKTKKLEYLVKTVHKQIFTQIMRMSCDLKLENINRANSDKAILKNRNNINIISGIINRLLSKTILQTFKTLKIQNRLGNQKQEQFITKISNSFQKMNSLYKRKIKITKQKTLELWKKKSNILSLYQTQYITNVINLFQQKLITDIIQVWKKDPKNWLASTFDHLQNLLNHFDTLNGIQLTFYPDPKRITKNQNLSYSQSQISSYRSLASKNSLRSSIYSYLGQQDIKYDQETNSAIIPLNAGQPLGIITITWENILPLSLFQKLLRVFQMAKNIIQHVHQLGTRLTYHLSLFQSSEWQQNLFNLQNNQIKDGRNMDNIQELLTKCSIANLQIFHEKNSQKPCFVYGKTALPLLKENIIQNIRKRLIKQKYFSLQKDGLKQHICTLQDNHSFCRFAFFQNNQAKQSDSIQIMIKSLVPIILRSGQRLQKQCNLCKIFEDQQQEQSDHSLNINDIHVSQKLLSFQEIVQIQEAQYTHQIQNIVTSFFSRTFPQLKLFVRTFYCLNQQSLEFSYFTSDNQKSVRSLCLPKSVTTGHQHDYTLFGKQAINDEWRNMIKVLQQNYINQNEEQKILYLYQKQKSVFRIMSKKLFSKVLLVFGTYQINTLQTELGSQLLGSIQDFIKIVKSNQNFVKKVDGLKWAQQVINQNSHIQIPLVLPLFDNISQPQIQNSFDDAAIFLMTKIKKEYQLFETQQILKIVQCQQFGKTNILDITNDQIFSSKELPMNLLLSQPLLSHRKISESQMLLRKSLNYGLKMRQSLIYIPSISLLNVRRQYAQKVAQSMLSCGQLIDKSGLQISQFLQKRNRFDKNCQSFISIPLRVTNTKKSRIAYVFVFTFSKQSQINTKIFETLVNFTEKYFSQLCKAVQAKRKIRVKQLLLGTLIPTFRQKRKQKIMQIIDKFAILHNHLKTKVEKLCKKCQTIFNSHQEQLLISSLKQLKTLLYKQRKYQSEAVFYFEQKIKQIFFFNSIKKALKKKSNFKLGIQTINNFVIHKIIQRMLQYLKSQQKQNKQFTFNKQLRLKQGINKVSKFCLKIQKKRKLQIFKVNFQIKLALNRDLKMVRQQFQIISFRNINKCFEFLNSRLNTVLSQYYKSPIQIQIRNRKNSTDDLKVIAQNIVQTNIIPISNSRLVVCIDNQENSQIKKTNNSFVKAIVKQFLEQLIPDWQKNVYIPYLHQNCQIMINTLSTLQKKQYSAFISLWKADRFNNQIFKTSQMDRQTKSVLDQMKKLIKKEDQINKIMSIRTRQEHSKRVCELKTELCTIQAQGKKMDTEAKIKKKTNSAYLMQHILHKQKQKRLGYQINNKQNQNQNNFYMKETLQQIQTIKKSTACMKRVHYLKIIPTWVKTLSNIENRINSKVLKQAVFNNLLFLNA